MTGQPKLNFPHPPARPDQTPNFSAIEIPAAGALDVPPLDLQSVDSRDYANGMIRVLDDEGTAVGPWAEYIADLDSDALLQGLRDMLRMRAVDKRLLNAQRQGKTSFYLQCTGEEAIGCGFQRQLSGGDMNFPTYRQQSLLIAADYPLRDLMGQVYSNGCDPLEGRQLPIMHSSRDYGFFSISGNLGTQYIQAVGWAMANALSETGEIAAGWIGDGATASNDFHAALLCASTYRPPVILNIVNNQWAISTHANFARGGNEFASRGLPYGLASIRVDGNDFLALYAVTQWARERAASGAGATHIEVLTYRAGAHSSSDAPSRYRPGDEYAQWPGGDPIDRLRDHLIAIGEWSVGQQTELECLPRDKSGLRHWPFGRIDEEKHSIDHT